MKVCRPRPLLVLLACLSGGIAHSALAATSPGKTPEVRSQAALVLDGTTGSVLYSRREGEAMPIASISKLMTALVVLDSGLSLDEPITVTREDVAGTHAEPSRLAVGTRLTRRELLRLALMASENRAAYALARSYEGGEPACIAAMNAKAHALGMLQTHFDDPTGLSVHNVASPSDLAKLVMAADHNATIREFSTAPSYSVKVGRRLTEFRSTNPLVRDKDWDLSVQKTGHIAAAGECLVLQAIIDGRQIVMVLLNSFGKYTRVADARRIRKWLATAELAATAKAGGADPES